MTKRLSKQTKIRLSQTGAKTESPKTHVDFLSELYRAVVPDDWHECRLPCYIVNGELVSGLVNLVYHGYL